jgi:hypothetical protein
MLACIVAARNAVTRCIGVGLAPERPASEFGLPPTVPRGSAPWLAFGSERPPTQPRWKHSVTESEEAGGRALPRGGALKRIVFTIRRTAHIVVASVAVELALDFGAGALAVVLAPRVGDWVYVVAGVVVVGSMPVLGLNIARVARREWRAHHPHRHASRT